MCQAVSYYAYALELTILNMRLCKSRTTEYRFIHHQLLHKSSAIPSLKAQIEEHPIEKLEIKTQNSINFYHLNHVLQDCILSYDLQTAMAVQTQLIKLNPKGFISLWNKILNLNCLMKKIRHAHKLFEKMPQRDVVSFNTIISTYMRLNLDIVECRKFFCRMQEEGVKPNHITFSALIGASSSLPTLHFVEMMHGQALRYGLSSNAFVGSAMVDAYAKKARLDDAIHAFDEINEVDLVSWNIMINGCACNGNKELASSVFARMRSNGLPLNSFTLASMTKTCLEPSDLNRGTQLHCCIVKAGLASETPISNALITMYSKCEEGMVSARRVFERMLEPNIITWTAMISGFMQNGQSEETIGVYQQMLKAGIKENEFSFASVLPAYSSLARLEQGMQVHARIIKSRFVMDLSVGNALIDMYFKCGSLEDAKQVFTTMESHDVVSWTAMITGFGQHGRGREAIGILKTMISEGFKPDEVTFLGVLSACSHGGLVDEGLRVFGSMIYDHGVKPRKQHYACVVDMLGRAGRLVEAKEFIEDMEIQSDALAWEALLSACRIHGEVELGARSAEKLMELEPRKDGPYVLLANIYADRGLWEDKGKVRERLDSIQLKKETGHSWVAL